MSLLLRFGIVCAAGIVALFGIAACRETPVDAAGVTASESQELPGGETLGKGSSGPFADAEVFFEFNTTDNDLGLQIFLDAEGWEKVDVSDPANRKIVQIHTQGPLSNLGITELRFESAEPSPAEVLALFPPGEYDFAGKTVDGGRLEGSGELSHVFIDPFVFSPSGGAVVDADDTTVSFNAPGAELVEIIIESDESENFFDVTVEAAAGDLDIPEQFLDSETDYKIELLAYHENGNRTIVESTFSTSP